MSEIKETKSVIPKDANDFVDIVERVLFDMANTEDFELKNCPIQNIFTDELYTRVIEMKAGYRVVSKIHKTNHPFFILKGKCVIYDNGEEIVLEAPYVGITKAGTRRILLILEDTIFSTVHSNPDNENLEQIEERIIEKHINNFLTDDEKEFINSPKNLNYEL